MKIEKVSLNGVDVAAITGEEIVITDTQSAIDLAMTARYETEADRLLLDKKNICNDFFILSTGVAGEILQKFTNYHFKMAIFGDYTHYTSKPLRDFIYESNRGHDFYFTATREEALKKLTEDA